MSNIIGERKDQELESTEDDGLVCPGCNERHFDYLGHEESSFLTQDEVLCLRCRTVFVPKQEQHMTIIGGWDKPEVADAQWTLVRQELKADPMTIGPYAAFWWAMDTIGNEWLGILEKDAIATTLLDAGCGVGHYAVLCKRLYPVVLYHGTDISQAMIDHAKKFFPQASFSVCDFKDNDFSDFDIVLVGQTIEQLDDPPAMLDLLLARARRYIILNRIRLTPDESHRIAESTYCGEMGRTWLWNREDITRRIEKYAQILAVNDWWATDQMTLVVKVRGENDESAKLCGCACGLDKDCTC